MRTAYRDGLGRKAVAIRTANGWHLTFMSGRSSYTRVCRSAQHMRKVMDANGREWRAI